MVLLASQIDHAGTGAATGEADIGHQRLAGAIDHAADDREAHRGLDVLQPFFQRFHGLDHVETLARAAGAADDLHAAGAQAQGFQDLEADLDLFDRIGRKADADRVADAHPQQVAKTDGGFHRAADKAAGLGDAQMDRGVGGIGQLLIGGGGKEDVAGLHADLEFVEIVVLQDLDMVEAGFHHRSRAGLAVFFQQVLFEAAGIDADADRAAVVAGGLDHLAHAGGIANIAGVDAQAGGAGLGGLDGALVVEMDVGDDRHRAFAADLAQGAGRGLVRGRDADDIGPGISGADHLIQRRTHVAAIGIGHGLDADRGVTAHRDAADHDLAGLAPVDIAPRTDRVMRHGWALFAESPPEIGASAPPGKP